MSLTCLDTLVALSNVDFPCATDDRPADYNESTSGYSLTDVEFGMPILHNCASEVWTILDEARTQAIREFKTDLRAKLRGEYLDRMARWSGTVGQIKSTGSLVVAKDFIGHRVRPFSFKGGKVVWTKVHVGLDLAGTYPLTFRSNDPLWTAPSDESIVVPTGGSWYTHEFATPIELPFFSKYVDSPDYLEYYALLDRGSAKPLNNIFACCGKPKGGLEYFETDGILADDAIGTGLTVTSYANGLVFEGYVTCDDLDWLCELTTAGGYDFSDVVARTIQFRGSALVGSKILDPITIDLCTQYGAEWINKQRNFLNERYGSNLDWIVQNIPVGVTDCFACKNESYFKKSKILV
jgi:hypothetical protein